MNTLSSILKFIGNRFEKIQGGTLAGASVSAGSYLDRPMTFPKSYASPPTVVACIDSTSTSATIGNLTVSPVYITNTGCTMRVFNAGSSDRTPAVKWIAIP